MRVNYWSNGKLAGWIRGIEKLRAGTNNEWTEWNKKAKNKHPIRFWIAEEGLDILQNIIFWIPDKIYSAKYYIINRWVDQSHALVAHKKHIRPGQYRDFDTRILICLFDELVDFIEIEKAYCNYRWQEDKMKTLSWWQGGKWRTRTWRNPEAGLAHLSWEIGLEEDGAQSQSETAKEILELYKWWTEVYPNRPDPMEVSGWSAYCDDKRDRGIGFLEKDSEEDKWDVNAMHDMMRKLEKEYDEEDTEMLIRLIKIRSCLWT
jgi:hypothetical protein